MSANEPLDLDQLESQYAEAAALYDAVCGHPITPDDDTNVMSFVSKARTIMCLIAAVRERDAEIARSATALRTYGKHRAYCGGKPCECGLGEALRQTGTEPPQPAEEA